MVAWGGVGFHDAEILDLVDHDAGQVVLRLHVPNYPHDELDLTITFAHARLEITDDEREEIADGGEWIHGGKLDACADGRFVHQFWLSWPKGGVAGVDPQQPKFEIEFDDAGMSLHVQGRLLDLGQPKETTATVEEMIAPLRQREAENPDDLLNKRRLADLVRLQETLAAGWEAAALDP
jgi:hypothetical protein